MKTKIGLTLLGLFATAAATMVAAPAQPVFTVDLAPARQTIAAGTLPKFVLSITNRSKHPVRIFRIDRRPDLQPVYAPLTITRDGLTVTVSSIIADPGVVTNRDRYLLQPGETMKVALTWFPEQWDELPPGAYEAKVSYSADSDSSRQLSNPVEIDIVPPAQPH